MAIRLSLPAISALLVTVFLFYLMQSLIEGADNTFIDEDLVRIIDIVRVKQPNEVQPIDPRIEAPPPPDELPPVVPPRITQGSIDETGIIVGNVPKDPGVDISADGFGISDGEYLPIVKVQPVYPRRALSRGLAGWAIVEFTVTAQGAVKNPVVVANCAWVNSVSSVACEGSPNGIFDRAATRAALKFKYKPKVINGEPVETTGVQNRIIFQISDG